MLKKRVEVLFEPSILRRLEEISHTQKRSVGSLVREAVEKYILEPTEGERGKALEWFAAQRGPVGSPEEIKEDILAALDEALGKGLETD